MTKYLSEQQIQAIFGEYKLPNGFAIMSQDSYNEELIVKKINAMKNPPDLLGAAVNMSIVGFGNKRFGQFRVEETLVNIANVFRTFQVSFQNEQNATLKDDEITPQRLCRVFRHRIRNYIKETNQTSYLWRKYSTRDEKFKAVVFRGSEYLEDLTAPEASYLLETIQCMDSKLNTNIQDRVLRVYEARGQKYKN
jgi:hypothetical protein